MCRQRGDIVPCAVVDCLTCTVCHVGLQTPYTVGCFRPMLFIKDNHILASIKIMGQILNNV